MCAGMAWSSTIVAQGGSTAVARVRGAVFDSVSRTHLAGALVQFHGVSIPVLGATFAARSDFGG